MTGWRSSRTSGRSRPRRWSRPSIAGTRTSARKRPRSDREVNYFPGWMQGDFESLRLEHVTRRFGRPGSPAALNDLSMTVARGEFVALLGPSGCGKSTALNCIAGLIPLSAGAIWLNDDRLDVLPPEKRGFGMVFQNYALFPHMTAVSYTHLRA